MAFIVIELEVPSESTTQLNQLVKASSNAHEGVVQVRNALEAVLGGAKDGQVIVAVRSTTSTPTASGGGTTATYNLK